MDQNELNPQESQQENQETITETQTPANEAKKFPKKLALIVLIVLVVVLSGGLALSKTVFNQSNRSTDTTSPTNATNLSEPKAVEQVFVNPVDGSKKNIKETEYYIVGAGNTEYYGRVSKINNDYIRMLPTAYKKGSVLTFTGKELHGPEAATYFKVSKVTKFQELTDTVVVNALKAADASMSDAFPSSNINKYVKEGQFQAYFFSDGIAFFAKTTSLDGNFLASSSHVYILRTEGTSSPQVSLVLAKPEQYNTRVSTDLAYWQNMKSDSQIAKAADAFEKQSR